MKERIKRAVIYSSERLGGLLTFLLLPATVEEKGCNAERILCQEEKSIKTT
jgi:hypothetical protein